MSLICFIYRISRILVFCLPVFCLTGTVNAQNLQGCGKQGGTMIYYQRNGFGSGLNLLLPRYDAPFSTLTTNTSICPRFTTVSIAVPTTFCCIGATDCTNNLVYDFTNIPCPIDDYAPYLFLSVGVAALVVIRKSRFKKPMIS